MRIKGSLEKFRSQMRDRLIATIDTWKGSQVEHCFKGWAKDVYSWFPDLDTQEMESILIELFKELEDYGWRYSFERYESVIGTVYINKSNSWWSILIKKIFGTKKERGSGLLPST